MHFDKPFVVFGNKVTHRLFASVAYIQSKHDIESVREDGAERQLVGTGLGTFAGHVRGDRIVYEAVETHWRATPHFKRRVFLKSPRPIPPGGGKMRFARRCGPKELADECNQAGV